ncbi:hypothetical protein [Streptodolium elevatio]
MRRIWGGAGAGGLGVNDVLMKDARLSVPARGLAVHLLLLPERARPDRARLASRPGESAKSIEGYLAELEEAGYLRRRTVWDRRGRAFEEVTVYPQAVADDAAAEVRGRVFHWLASPERQPERALSALAGTAATRKAEPAGMPEAGAATAVDAEPATEDAGEDESPAEERGDGLTEVVAGDRAGDLTDGQATDAVGGGTGSAAEAGAECDMDEPEPAAADGDEGEGAVGDLGDLADLGDRPEPVPAGACSGAGAGSGAVRP